MPRINCIVESKIDLSIRSRQICGMYDLPLNNTSKLEWNINAPIEDKKWNIGLIIGPSGSGKSTIANHLWKNEIQKTYTWDSNSVIDDFSKDIDIEKISEICGAVGFNTIPAWLRPYKVLSNGEKFRVSLARSIIESESITVIDEFTSVVDRQTAKIGSHAVQKYIRRNDKQFVGISCHYDIIDWLQPDWIIDASKQTFEWRSLRSRPEIKIEIAKVKYETWNIFKKYHYINQNLNPAAQCYGLFIDNQIVSFVAILHRPSKWGGWKAVSRVVTLPDYQGLGFAFILIEYIASAYTSLGWKFRNYPAHPSFIKSHKRSKVWKNCGQSIPALAGAQPIKGLVALSRKSFRTPYIFEYMGSKLDKTEAIKLVNNG